MILMIQNDSVTSGTLLSQPMELTVGNLFMVFSCRGEIVGISLMGLT